MKTNFELNADDEVRVFNQVFGISDMTRGKLSTQSGEMKMDSKRHCWPFRNASSSAIEGTHRFMQERLVTAISELGLEDQVGKLTLPTHPSPNQRILDAPTVTASTPVSLPKANGSGRKRRRTANDREPDENDEYVPPGQTVPMDVDDILMTPARPRTPKTPRKENAIFQYDRPCGPVMPTQKEYDETKEAQTWPEIEVPLPVLASR